jgi:hypothetical protein
VLLAGAALWKGELSWTRGAVIALVGGGATAGLGELGFRLLARRTLDALEMHEHRPVSISIAPKHT